MTSRAWPGRPAAPCQNLFTHNLQPNPLAAAFLGTLACVVLMTTVPCAWGGPGLCGRRDSRACGQSLLRLPYCHPPPALPDPQRLPSFPSRAGRQNKTNSVQPPVLQAVPHLTHSLKQPGGQLLSSVSRFEEMNSGRLRHLPRRYMGNAKQGYKTRSVTLQLVFYPP